MHTFLLQRTQRTALACAAALLAHTAAQAADSIQLKFDTISGPNIVGLSTVEDHRGSINTHSFQFGVGVGISSGVGGVPRQASQPSVSEIVTTQTFDSSYNALNAALVSGGRYNATTSFLGGGARAPGSYLTMATGTTAISGLSVSSGGERPSVSVSQAFRSFNLAYDPAVLGAPPGPKLEVGYDSVRGVASGVTSRTLGAGGGGGAAGGLYLRLGAGADSIYGDSGDSGYENWIKLSSFQMGIGLGLAPNGADFTASRPSVSELTVTQVFDGAVPAILGNLLRGRSIGQATLELVQMSGARSVTTMQLELDNVLFSGLSMSSGGDMPQVSESLNFSGYTQTIWDLNADGSRGDPSIFSFDIERNMVRNGAQTAASVAGFGPGQLVPMAPVPEPHTWALMAGGAAMLAMLRRRRQA